jgi:capsular polysaccharide biosynthesis protein
MGKINPNGRFERDGAISFGLGRWAIEPSYKIRYKLLQSKSKSRQTSQNSTNHPAHFPTILRKPDVIDETVEDLN